MKYKFNYCTICRCIYGVAENKASEEFDISSSLYK